MNDFNKDRTGYLGASDANRLMRGHDEIVKLWREKVGKQEPEDLSHVFRVQLGTYTEPFHRQWIYNETEHEPEEDYETTLGHDELTWMQAHADARCARSGLLWEFKHTNHRSTLDTMIDSYLPQLAHMCYLDGKNEIYLSFIKGNEDPEYHLITVPAPYIVNLVELESWFWDMVSSRPEPTDEFATDELQSKVDSHAGEVLIDKMRTVDMSTNNRWVQLSTDLHLTKSAHDLHKQSLIEIKKLIEPDVRIAHGNGIQFTRDKRGALRMRIDQ